MFSKEHKIEFLKLYGEYLGNVSVAVEKFNEKFKEKISRRTYYNWRENPEALADDGATFADLISDADNVVIDRADFFLKAQTSKNNLKAICFFLKHRHPEYRTKIDVSNPEVAQANKEIEELKQMFEYAKHNSGDTTKSNADTSTSALDGNTTADGGSATSQI